MSALPQNSFVFVSYSRADLEFITQLQRDLYPYGVTLWIDSQGLEAGTEDWEDALRNAIRASIAVVFIASPNSRQSRFVKDELRIARMYNRRVYPLWAAGEEWMDSVPIGMGGSQYIDLRESHYAGGVERIAAVLTGKAADFVAELAPDLGAIPLTPQNAPRPTPAPTPIAPVQGGARPIATFEPVRNPYKGLRAFKGQDAQDFFGRTRLINELIETLKNKMSAAGSARFLALVGASGSGKSSVIMAGLVPALTNGALPGSERWLYVDPILPGGAPLEALSVALASESNLSLKAVREDLEDSARGLHLFARRLLAKSDRQLIIFIDQFEEIFSPAIPEKERRLFIDLLVTAATEPHGCVTVLLTMRADFYDRPMNYPDLGKLIETQSRSALPMEIEDLREVIERPAALPDVQMTFEGDLVGDLLFEIRGQAGALPLLQFALDQLFRDRRGHVLTQEAYQAMGGVRGALSRHAESTYSELPDAEHRTLTRALFLRLIEPGATEQEATRYRAALSELNLPDPKQTEILKQTADAFIAARLLTTNVVNHVTTIEISHEALIREWPRLADWTVEAREDIRFQKIFREHISEWVRRGRPRGSDLAYRGTELVKLRAWAKRNVLSSDESRFIKSSRNRRVRLIVGIIIFVYGCSVLALAGSGGILFSNVFMPTYVALTNEPLLAINQAAAEYVATSTIGYASNTATTFDPGKIAYAADKTKLAAITTKRLVRDFIADATFTNPSYPRWDYGFIFRLNADPSVSGGSGYRMIVRSTGYWEFFYGASLISSGTTTFLDSSAGESNKLRVIVKDTVMLFYLNDNYITTQALDDGTPGVVQLATSALVGDWVSGGVVNYDHFRLWTLGSANATAVPPGDLPTDTGVNSQ